MTDLVLIHDWSDIAFSSRKPWKSRTVTFILAPCVLSSDRIKQLIAEYLRSGDIVLGIAQEDHIDGLGGHGAFATLQQHAVDDFQQQIASSDSPHRLYTLHYAQRDERHVVEKLKPRKVIGVRGSWHHMFHVRPLYYTLMQHQIPYELVPRFVDAATAKALATPATNRPPFELYPGTEADMFEQVDKISTRSLDYIFRTGCLLAHGTTKFKPILYGYNKVVPHQHYAMQHGSLRETHFSPPNDANYYDTIHAEMDLLVRANKKSVQLDGASLFINLLPCPSCARTLSQTGLKEIVYQHDHSDGYAAELLEACDVTVRRYIKKEEV